MITALPKAHVARFRFIATLLRGLFYLAQAGTQSFVDNGLKWCVQFGCDGSRAFKYFIVYG